MKLIKATICLLIILLQLFYTVSAMDSYYSSDNRMPLPRNSNNLSIKTHWQYIGHYLYKLLHENDFFSEATKAEIDKIFGINQNIINQLDFTKNEQDNGDFLDNEEISEERENIVETVSDDTEGQEKQAGEENTKAEDASSTQEVGAEETPTDMPTSEESLDSVPTTQQTTEVPESTQLPVGDAVSSEEVPLYGQIGAQDAAPISEYNNNSMSDPMMQQQNGNLTGYETNGNAPMYNNMGAQNYDGSYSGFGGQPAYGGQTYNTGMGTANYGGMNNSYNNMSDFQQNNQNMGMYQQQQQGMYQQQDGAQNPYNQMSGMSDNQYSQGMTQGSDGMPQYGQQQMQPYDSNQQQQTNGGYPPDYQDQGDMASQSSEDIQMQQQQNEMQTSVEDGMEEQQFPSQTEQSEGQFVGEEQSRADDMGNGETESRSETQSTDENAEASSQVREQNTTQQRFEEETDTNETEQRQMFSSPQELKKNNSNDENASENSAISATRMTDSQQEDVIQEANVASTPLQARNTKQDSVEISAQTPQNEQLSYTRLQGTATATSLTSGELGTQPSFVEETGRTRNSVFDGAEWDSQRGSSTWGVVENEAPPKFDPNAPLTSKDF